MANRPWFLRVCLVALTLLMVGSSMADSFLAPSSEYAGPRRRATKQSLAPVGVSFLVADVKMTPDGMKILELGCGMYSGFQGYDKLYPDKEMITLLWDYIHRDLRLPMWYVSEKDNPYDHVSEMLHQLSKFKEREDSVIGDVSSLERALAEGSFGRPRPDFDPHDARTYSAIVLAPTSTEKFKKIERLLKKYPHVLLLDESAMIQNAVNDKYATADLFGQDLQVFRPRGLLIPRVYRKGLASKIQGQIPSEAYVVKPVDAYAGQGVLPARRGADLDALLHKIFPDDVRSMLDEKILKNRYKDFEADPYRYWKGEPNPVCLVESLENSTPIVVEDRPFDATLRVVFVLRRKDQDIKLHILGMYWKLPVAPVGGGGSLRAAIVSKITEDRLSSAGVDPGMDRMVRENCRRVLPEVYRKMIAWDPDAWTDELLSSDDEARVALGLYRLTQSGVLSPEQWVQLARLVEQKKPLYDVLIFKLLNHVSRFGQMMDPPRLRERLLRSGVDLVRERTLALALATRESYPSLAEAAMNAGEAISRNVDPSVRAEFLSLLCEQGRIPQEELLRYFQEMYPNAAYGPQWVILDSLLRKGFLPDTPWVWPNLKHSTATRFAVWISSLADKIHANGVHPTQSRFSALQRSLVGNERLAVHLLEAAVRSGDEPLTRAFEKLVILLADKVHGNGFRQLAVRLKAVDKKNHADSDTHIEAVYKVVRAYFSKESARRDISSHGTALTHVEVAP